VSKRLQNIPSALFMQLWKKIEPTRKNTMDSNPYSLLSKTFLFSLFLSLIESCFRSDIALCSNTSRVAHYKSQIPATAQNMFADTLAVATVPLCSHNKKGLGGAFTRLFF
jgi:hypothetical protein